MSTKLSDYFANEAGEYLDQLERLLSQSGLPDTSQFLRLATGVRGSAQMAGAETVSGVAERLEDAARAVANSSVSWSEEIRLLSQQTVADLKLLVRALNRWGQEEERRVREAIIRWDDREASGIQSSQPVPVSDLFFDDEGPHVVEDVEEAAEVVSIDTLLLRGEPALRRALEIRPEVEAAAQLGSGGAIRLDELLRELFELVELGLSSDTEA